MIPEIGIQAIIVTSPVGEFHIDGRITVLHQSEIQNQPAGPSIAVYKGVNALEFKMEQSRAMNGVPLVVCRLRDEPLHLHRHEIWLRRLVVSAHNAHGDASIHPPILGLIKKHEGMDLSDDSLRKRRLGCDELLHVPEGVAMPHSL